jgi:hypothetical protein
MGILLEIYFSTCINNLDGQNETGILKNPSTCIIAAAQKYSTTS